MTLRQLLGLYTPSCGYWWVFFSVPICSRLPSGARCPGWRASLSGHLGNYQTCITVGPTSYTMPHYQGLVRVQRAGYKGNVCGAPLSVLETSHPDSVHYFSGSSFPETLKCLSRFLILKKDWNVYAFSPMA